MTDGRTMSVGSELPRSPPSVRYREGHRPWSRSRFPRRRVWCHPVRTVSGSLYGLAYGDALGKPTEFMSMSEIIAAYGPSGPVSLEGHPALVTDDTQMALAVAWALCEAPP